MGIPVNFLAVTNSAIKTAHIRLFVKITVIQHMTNYYSDNIYFALPLS